MPPSETQHAHGKYKTEYFKDTSLNCQTNILRKMPRPRALSQWRVFEKQLNKKNRRLRRRICTENIKPNTSKTRMWTAKQTYYERCHGRALCPIGVFLKDNSKENAAIWGATCARKIRNQILQRHESELPDKHTNKDAAAARFVPLAFWKDNFEEHAAVWGAECVRKIWKYVKCALCVLYG